jgi:molybdopterin synthase catalytic subunit
MFAITRDAIDPRAVEASVHGDAQGGVVTFLGIVRERASDGREVSGLSYEAYDEMAVAEFERLAKEVRDRYGEVELAIVHRVGELRVGEIAHRAAAFDACEYAIDELKQRAPIWKKEHYVEGDAAWIRAAR